MASFELEQTPSRAGGAGPRASQRVRRHVSSTTSCPPVQPLRGNNHGSISAVNHRIQHQEDELQEMKLRQQRLEEQLLSFQQENEVVRKEVSPF